MELLLRVGAADRLIDFGVATTKTERAAVLAQRFWVYQRHGYYRAGLRVDRDGYDRKAVYFMATLAGAGVPDLVLGSAWLILGESDSRFRFPAEKAFALELPEAVLASPVCQRMEVSRVITERPEGIVLGSLLTPLGLIQAIILYGLPRGFRCGLALIKRRLLLALRGVGLPFHELRHAASSTRGTAPWPGTSTTTRTPCSRSAGSARRWSPRWSRRSRADATADTDREIAEGGDVRLGRVRRICRGWAT